MTRPTILVADDYPQNLTLFTVYLRNDYEVVTASSAEAAAARVAQGVDAALLDLNYQGGMTGLECIQHIRANPATADLPAMALTAHASPEDRVRCLAAGFDDYLAKPVLKAQMLQAIETLFAQKAAA